jgi:hypothetical protein
MASKAEDVAAKAAALERTMAKSQATTDQMCRLLDDFVEGTAKLQAVMRPVHSHIQGLMRVQDNINLTISLCESMLTQFDVSRDVERQVLRPPRPRWFQLPHVKRFGTARVSAMLWVVSVQRHAEWGWSRGR